MKRPSCLLWMPPSLRYGKFPPAAKLLFMEVADMIGDRDYCVVTDGELADRVGASVRSVQRNLRVLRFKGYLSADTVSDERRVSLTETCQAELNTCSAYSLSKAGIFAGRFYV